MSFEQKTGIVKAIFQMSGTPLPDQRQLTSRLFPLGRVVEYNNTRIVIITRKPDELLKQMRDYFNKQDIVPIMEVY